MATGSTITIWPRWRVLLGLAPVAAEMQGRFVYVTLPDGRMSKLRVIDLQADYLEHPFNLLRVARHAVFGGAR